MIDYIEPCWTVQDFRDLAYTLNQYHDSDFIDRYVAAGHHRDNLRLWTYFDPLPMPAGVDHVRATFQQHWQHVTVAVNLFMPAQYMPTHSDLYGRYREVTPVGNRTIHRAVVMLEPGLPGQILEIGDRCYSGWRAGAVYTWQDQDPHAFYNMSLQERCALQITGVR